MMNIIWTSVHGGQLVINLQHKALSSQKRSYFVQCKTCHYRVKQHHDTLWWNKLNLIVQQQLVWWTQILLCFFRRDIFQLLHGLSNLGYHHWSTSSEKTLHLWPLMTRIPGLPLYKNLTALSHDCFHLWWHLLELNISSQQPSLHFLTCGVTKKVYEVEYTKCNMEPPEDFI